MEQGRRSLGASLSNAGIAATARRQALAKRIGVRSP